MRILSMLALVVLTLSASFAEAAPPPRVAVTCRPGPGGEPVRTLSFLMEARPGNAKLIKDSLAVTTDAGQPDPGLHLLKKWRTEARADDQEISIRSGNDKTGAELRINHRLGRLFTGYVEAWKDRRTVYLSDRLLCSVEPVQSND